VSTFFVRFSQEDVTSQMKIRKIIAASFLALAVAWPALAKKTPQPFYQQTNLTTLKGTRGTTKDAHLVNPWGLTFVPGTFIWIGDNNGGGTSLYNDDGTIVSALPFVTIPVPAGVMGESAPTGAITNPQNSAFGSNAPEFGDAIFLFATENGTVAGWNLADGTTATLPINNSAAGAVYKGLAIANDGTGDRLYVTNFSKGKIEVYDTGFNSVSEAGSFTDPNIPAKYSPFGIFTFNGNLWVTYAIPDKARTDEVNGKGNGFVDIFSPTGTLVSTFAAQGRLDSPWGIAHAPANFGPLSNLWLIGNFGDGKINAYDSSGKFVSTLNGKNGKALVNPGLWSLAFGDGTPTRPVTELLFTAGGTKQTTGTFGRIDLVIPPAAPAASPTSTMIPFPY
jgi:uncharacterized protein (TIGR03118 family)